ncbi:MAG: type II toxin-antitoxin system VapC family toxin [Rhizobiaceae bacterium]
MIVDASALLAILFDEPEAEQFAALLAQAEAPRMSVVNFLEAAIRIDQQDSVVATQAFDAFIELSGIAIEPVTVEHTRLARRAYAMFGKGRHRAGLNFGDVFAYALAKSRQEPLLYKGNDFVHTDVTRAA